MLPGCVRSAGSTPPKAPHSTRTTTRAGCFAAAVKRAELPNGTTTPDLRHHFASVLNAAGKSVVAVAEWLGHDGAALVLNTYGHLMPNSEDRMRRAIDGAYADSCAPQCPKDRR